MAYLYLRKNGRAEIREARNTERGPRSYTLVSFQPPLTESHLERAESAARRPFERKKLLERAAELALPVARASANRVAQHLVAELRGGAELDAELASLLLDQLATRKHSALPEELEEVAEWVGTHEHARGRALRDLLRLYGTIAQSREAVREPERRLYPKFEVRPRDERQAS